MAAAAPAGPVTADSIGEVIGQRLLSALEAAEEKLDADLDAMEKKLDDEDERATHSDEGAVGSGQQSGSEMMRRLTTEAVEAASAGFQHDHGNHPSL